MNSSDITLSVCLAESLTNSEEDVNSLRTLIKEQASRLQNVWCVINKLEEIVKNNPNRLETKALVNALHICMGEKEPYTGIVKTNLNVITI